MGAEAIQETIERFYAAFGQCNGVAMAACYAPDAHFRDSAFGDLHGADIGAMWRMLTAGQLLAVQRQLRLERRQEWQGHYADDLRRARLSRGSGTGTAASSVLV